MKIKLKYLIILIILFISLISSIILSAKPIEEICDITQGCSVVQNSNYAKTLGIKNSHLGIIGFSALIILLTSQIKKPTAIKKILIKSGFFLAFLVAIYFIYIQVSVLNAFCRYCIIVDISSIINLGIILFWKK